MSNIKLDIPNITVVIDKGNSYNVVVDQSNITPRVGTGSFITVADTALTASYALRVSGSIDTAISASYAQTASYAANSGGTIPAGTVSSSSQINVKNTAGIATLATTGSNTFRGNQIISGTVSSSAFIVDGGISTQFLKADGTLDNSVYITADGVPSLPAYTVSSSTQIVESLPNGTVSSSGQVVTYVSGSTIVPNRVQSNEYKLIAGAVSLIFTGSITSGIFGATEYVMPFIPTGSFCAATVEYVASRAGGLRVGVILAGWSGSNTTVTDISSTDVGDTSDIRFSLVQSGGYIKLRAESVGSGSYPWTVQSLFKLFPILV